MTPQEYAKYLYDKYYGIPLYIKTVKQCCLITVNEIINTIEFSSQADELSKINYWEEVKQEIEKL